MSAAVEKWLILTATKLSKHILTAFAVKSKLFCVPSGGHA
jgi:hypothetical protein